jgi:hypothetical protein
MMRRLLTLLLILAISVGCTALRRIFEQRPPREQLVRIPFPFPPARSKVEVSGTWLRAINLAMDDFLPPDREAKSPADACLFQRENYDVVVVEPEGTPASEEMDAGTPELDGGERPTPDQAAHLLYVIILLRADVCEQGDSPLMDAGATYAIDTERWRIVGWSL